MFSNVFSVMISAIFVLIAFRFMVLPVKPGRTQIPAASQPNIVLILTDDQRWDTLDDMPTVQAELVENGIYFPNAFVTTPLCAPSRASILSGQYAHNHGVHHNSGPEGGGSFEDSTTLATILKDQAGYRTAYIGKYLNGYRDINSPPGWDEWQVYRGRYDPDYRGYYSYTLNINGEQVFYGTDPEDYSTDVLTQQAVDFIQRYDGQPFFLTVAFFAPHSPAIPAPRHEGTFDGIPPWRPASFDEQNISDKPDWFNDLEPLDYEEVDQTRQGQLESLLAVDEGINALIEALLDVGQESNTAIIYTSDNGLTWGEHRMFGKSCPHEECIQVPLIFWFPPYTQGTVRDHFTLNIDLLPSIAWFVGAGLPPEVDGERLFANPNIFSRSDFLLEHWNYDTRDSPTNQTAVIPDYQGLRAPRWTYVEYATQEGELYDLKLDTNQLFSVFNHPVYANVKNKLAKRLEELVPP